MARIHSVVKSGYTLTTAIGRRSNLVIPPIVYGMLFFLLDKAGMQKDIYTFHLTNIGKFVTATNQMHMHFGAYDGEGWKVKIHFGRSDTDNATGILQLPPGMLKEAHTPKFRRILVELNDTGWKQFLSPVKKPKALASDLVPRTVSEKEQSTAVTPVLLGSEPIKAVLPAGMVRKPKKAFPDINIIYFGRITEIRVRSREIEGAVQQTRVELEAIERTVNWKNFGRITEIQVRLQKMALEAKSLKAEQDSFVRLIKGMSKGQLIELVLNQTI